MILEDIISIIKSFKRCVCVCVCVSGTMDDVTLDHTQGTMGSNYVGLRLQSSADQHTHTYTQIHTYSLESLSYYVRRERRRRRRKINISAGVFLNAASPRPLLLALTL